MRWHQDACTTWNDSISICRPIFEGYRRPSSTRPGRPASACGQMSSVSGRSGGEERWTATTGKSMVSRTDRQAALSDRKRYLQPARYPVIHLDDYSFFVTAQSPRCNATRLLSAMGEAIYMGGWRRAQSQPASRSLIGM